MSPTGVPSLVLAVRRFLDGEHGPARGSHGLVAVSGGADSTALATALAALAPPRALALTIGHVDHGLRPTSADEARQVEALAERLGLPARVEVVRVDPARAVEATARRRRYAALGRMADAAGATWIATGHTRDDQVETVLLRLARGAGRGGLAGMRPRRGRLLRPLLEVTRADVRWYLGDLGVSPIEDPSNGDLHFARNRVRHLIVPLLERELGAQLGAHVAALADRLRDEDDLLDAIAAERGRALGVDECLPATVGREPAALGRRIVRAWLRARGVRSVGSRHVEAILRLARRDGGGISVVPGAGRIERLGPVLALDRAEAPAAPPFLVPVQAGAEVRGPAGAAWRVVFSAVEAPGGAIATPADASSAVFDVDRLPGPLAVRSVRPGDRIAVPGVGTRKLQDVLVDARVPRGRRHVVPVVVGGDEILWVPGLVRAAAARVGDATTRVLRATVRHGEVFGLPAKIRCGTLSDEMRATPARRQ